MAVGNTTVVQGVLSTIANDTYVQAVIGTGLTGSDSTAFRIKELILEHPVMGGNGQISEMQLTRGSRAAIQTFVDTGLLVKDKRYVGLTTSGAIFANSIVDYVYEGDIIVVEQQIYLGFKTTALAALAGLGYKLILEEVKISADVRIGLLATRLS